MATIYSNTNKDYYLKLEVSESNINISANTSVVNWTLYLVSGTNSFSGTVQSGYLNINGSRVWTSGSSQSIGRYSTAKLGSGSMTVSHNADGKKAVSLYAYYSAYSSGWGPQGLTINTIFTLSTIPRRSSFSGISQRVIGQEMTITINKAASSFTHEFWYHLPGQSWVKVGNKHDTSVTFTIPIEAAKYITNSNSGRLDVSIRTWNGSTNLGDTYDYYTINLPELKPTISDITFAETNNELTNKFSVFLQKKSQIKYDIEAQGIYGSTIKSYNLKLDGVSYTGNGVTMTEVQSNGELQAVATVTDSRGNSQTMTKTVSIVQYDNPVITSLDFYFCNADGTGNSAGTNTKVIVKGKVHPVNNQNTKSLQLQYKAHSAESYNTRVLYLSDWEFTAETIITSTDPTITYEFLAILTDKLGSNSMSAVTGLPVISRLAGGKGVTLFAEAKNEGFWVRDVDYTISKEELQQLTTDSTVRLYDLFKKIMSAKYTTNGWEVTKYPDGSFKAYKVIDYTIPAGSWSSWGGLYYAPSGIWSFPSDIGTVKKCSVTCADDTGGVWITQKNWESTKTGQIYAVTINKPGESKTVRLILDIEG